MDVECGIDASAFFRYLEEKHVLYGWGKSGVCAYGEAFVKKLKMYEHVIGEQARRLFPGIEYIAMPVEVPAEIARRTHLMQTMPRFFCIRTVLRIATSARRNLIARKMRLVVAVEKIVLQQM